MAESSHSNLSFWDHISELRTRLLRSILVILIATCVGLFTARQVLSILVRPLSKAMVHKDEKPLCIKVDKDGRMILAPESLPVDREKISQFRLEFQFESTGEKVIFGPDYRTNFYYFNPVDPFLLWLKASLILGVVLSLPYIFLQIWAFISPGMTSLERKSAKPIIYLGMILFPMGVGFAYFMLSFALGFFTRYAFPGLEPHLNIMEYINFALTLMIASGIVFEFPVVIIVLTWVGVVNSRFLRKYRKHAYMILMIIAAIVSPPDIVTMFIIGIPLVVLYEVSIFFAMLIERKRKTA